MPSDSTKFVCMFTKKILDVFLKFVRILEKHREFFFYFSPFIWLSIKIKLSH